MDEQSKDTSQKITEPAHYTTDKAPKPVKQVPLAAAIASVAVVCVLSVLITFSLTSKYMRRQQSDTIIEGQGTGDSSPFSEIDIIDKLFRSKTIRELDDRALLEGALHGYVDATGDRYADYFNEEEWDAQISDQNGELCGIGITVVSQTIEYQGREHTLMMLTDVYEESPAHEAGLLPGDYILKVGTGEDEVFVTDIGYDEAIERIRGLEGTDVYFTALRKTTATDESVSMTEIPMKAVRKKLIIPSVKYRVYGADAAVGIISVSKFNNTTAPQFSEAVDTLRTMGCTRFVVDMRDNPGGLLTAVEDLVTYFLAPGDVMLYSRDNQGNKTTYPIEVDGDTVKSGSGTLKSSDVGRFKGLDMTVLVNGNTASAAELFTSNVLYYKLGKVIGTKTYGKGTMQTTYSLSSFGYAGALKLTTQYYDPPSGINYDGIGLKPDIEVELTEEAQAYMLVLLPEELDNQLAAAVRK